MSTTSFTSRLSTSAAASRAIMCKAESPRHLAYIECKSGVCGSMLLGALIDLCVQGKKDENSKHRKSAVEQNEMEQKLIGDTLQFLQKEFEKIQSILPKACYELSFCYQQICNVRSGTFSVQCHPAATHDNNQDSHKQTTHHKHATHASHDHNHNHDHDHDSLEGNTYKKIRLALEKSTLAKSVKEYSLEIFAQIAIAEAHIHQVEIDAVHFHEVGAIDSIIDIVGCALLIDALGMQHIRSSAINVGGGHVLTAHGKLPVPAPATCELLKDIPITSSDEPYELCTPTGAALVRIYSQSFGPLLPMKMKAIGYGAGSHKLAQPNILRLFLADASASTEHLHIQDMQDQQLRQDRQLRQDIQQEHLVTLSTNIDDMTPEQMSQLIPQCMALGALDCWITPILMKKGRMAHQCNILCARKQRLVFIDFLFQSTTTLGIRIVAHSRFSLRKRERRVYNTQRFGQIVFKVVEWNGIKRAKPEHSSILRICQEVPDVSSKEIFQFAQKWIENTLKKEQQAGKEEQAGQAREETSQPLMPTSETQ